MPFRRELMCLPHMCYQRVLNLPYTCSLACPYANPMYTVGVSEVTCVAILIAALVGDWLAPPGDALHENSRGATNSGTQWRGLVMYPAALTYNRPTRRFITARLPSPVGYVHR